MSSPSDVPLPSDEDAAADPHLDPFIARLYDGEHVGDTADVVWALQLARAGGGHVIDLGCGSGRLTLPLAEAGCEVLAVDHSSAMLDRLKQKLAPAARAVRERVRAERGDLRTWQPDAGAGDLAIMGYNTIAALLTPQDQRHCLSAVAGALRPGGVLALATAALSARLLPLPEGLEREVYRRPAPELGSGVELRRRDVHRWTDETHQIRRLALIYDIVQPDGGRRRQQFEYAARYSTRWELEHLLSRCGFTDVQANGGYGGEPFVVEGGLLVMTARKPGA